MFPLYSHPATRFRCRHCHADAGHDPEFCVYCGPICAECLFTGDCPKDSASAKPQETTPCPGPQTSPQ